MKFKIILGSEHLLISADAYSAGDVLKFYDHPMSGGRQLVAEFKNWDGFVIMDKKTGKTIK